MNKKRDEREIIKRWDKLGFCDGLKGEIDENISSLYEYHE